MDGRVQLASQHEDGRRAVSRRAAESTEERADWRWRHEARGRRWREKRLRS